jgi:trimeric autotransporter adhesin
MSSITNDYINALLADAAYAKDLTDGLRDDALKRALSERMTPQLAEFIAANFEIVAHKESNDVIDSGFDATVWKGKAGSAYDGRTFVSLQGTVGLGDFLTDISLAAPGNIGTAQIVDMINWWRSLTAPQGQSLPKLVALPSNLFGWQPSGVVGTGQLAGVDNVQVNGHSLGGHLASAFARLFGSSVNIE